jgi:glutamate-1-semialdehyde 2,1-aminomutase
MVPSARRVRFTGSGTESTLLAIRLARAFSGKQKILRFAGHFHGWHDQVAFGVSSHFDGSAPPGILPEVAQGAIVCPPNDLDAVAAALDEHDDVAAVILEPTGATFGLVPLGDGFLAALRKLTQAKNVLLIFDEVITGFRVAPGGAQQLYGVTPDLATFAKIVAGGFPGGAVAGRSDVMDAMGHRDDREWTARHRVPHQGTFNANPITAAAGLATLKLVAEGDAIRQADQAAESLRDRMNEVLRKAGSAWVAYGQSSGFHLFLNPKERAARAEDIYSGKIPSAELKGSTPSAVLHALRCGMIVGGADIFPWPGGCVSAVHSPQDIETTAAALALCVKSLHMQAAR